MKEQLAELCGIVGPVSIALTLISQLSNRSVFPDCDRCRRDDSNQRFHRFLPGQSHSRCKDAPGLPMEPASYALVSLFGGFQIGLETVWRLAASWVRKAHWPRDSRASGSEFAWRVVLLVGMVFAPMLLPFRQRTCHCR